MKLQVDYRGVRAERVELIRRLLELLERARLPTCGVPLVACRVSLVACRL